jgi:hypothetical protein
MKTHYFFVCIIIFTSLSSFNDNKACEYAGSNIGFIRTQTTKAIEAKDLNISRYHAYKALNAIEKSKQQFEACGCDYAVKNINESLENLKRATRVTSLNGTKILLNRALESELGSLEALEEHDELHGSVYESDVLSLNTTTATKEKNAMKLPPGGILEKKIDVLLINYENSLAKVVNTVPCKEAYDYALGVYEHCEQQLLRTDLTEAKQYLNLRTKEITEAALLQLEDCK